MSGRRSRVSEARVRPSDRQTIPSTPSRLRRVAFPAKGWSRGLGQNGHGPPLGVLGKQPLHPKSTGDAVGVGTERVLPRCWRPGWRRGSGGRVDRRDGGGGRGAAGRDSTAGRLGGSGREVCLQPRSGCPGPGASPRVGLPAQRGSASAAPSAPPSTHPPPHSLSFPQGNQ